MDLADWLQRLGLERYDPAFRGNEIDDTVLPNLTAEDFKDLGLAKKLLPVTNTRKIGKHSMFLNSATPRMEVNPETYQVRADGRLLTCEPAEVLPMAQRYFVY